MLRFGIRLKDLQTLQEALFYLMLAQTPVEIFMWLGVEEIIGNEEIYYKKSTDGGTTWKQKRLTWNSGESILPVIAVDSSGNFHVVWEDDSPGNDEIFYTHK